MTDSGTAACPPGPRALPPPGVRRCPFVNKAERAKPIIPVPSIHPVQCNTIHRTTYDAEYYWKKAEKTPMYTPSRTPIKTSGQFDVDSMYRIEFVRHPIERFKKKVWRPDKEYKLPSQPMSLFSSYKVAYQRKHGQPAISAKPRYGPEINPPLLDDLSSYRQHYVAHCLPKKPAKKTREEMTLEYTNQPGPVDGITTYKKDYVATRPCPSVSAKPAPNPIRGTGVFDDRTVYRCAYEPYYFDDDVNGCIPPEVYDQLYPPKGKCDDVLCYPDPEPARILPDPVAPTPPCPCPKPPFKCPYPWDLRCQPRVVPCVSPYKLKSYLDDYGTTHISLENNQKGDLRAGKPAEVDCPPTYRKFR